MTTFKNKNNLIIDAEIFLKNLRTMRLGQNLLVLIKKSVYTIRDWGTELSSDLCTISIIKTRVYPAIFNKYENSTVPKPHDQITQINTNGER